MSHTPPGWYSEEDVRHCYWDGGQWDECVEPVHVAVEPGLSEHSPVSLRDAPITPVPIDASRLHRVGARIRGLISAP
jgi:hypothetical protein